MTLATLAYFAVSAACIAIVAGWLLIRLCNAITRPDDALAGILRTAYHMIYLAESGQIALAHFRWMVNDNRAKLARAVQPVDAARLAARAEER